MSTELLRIVLFCFFHQTIFKIQTSDMFGLRGAQKLAITSTITVQVTGRQITSTVTVQVIGRQITSTVTVQVTSKQITPTVTVQLTSRQNNCRC